MKKLTRTEELNRTSKIQGCAKEEMGKPSLSEQIRVGKFIKTVFSSAYCFQKYSSVSKMEFYSPSLPIKYAHVNTSSNFRFPIGPASRPKLPFKSAKLV